MLSDPARSAIVLETFRTRWNPRAERCICFIAVWSSPLADSSTWHVLQTSTGPISALMMSGVSSKRLLWSFLASSILSRTMSEPSALGGSTSFS